VTVFILVRRCLLDLLVPLLLVALFFLVRAPGVAFFIAGPDGAVRAGDPSRPEVSLMINVDWGEEFIPQILDVLDQKGVKVTFFVVGGWAKKNPELLKEMSARGHEIASHGELHKLATQLDDATLEWLISQGITTLSTALGHDPAPLFAPPAGDCDARVVRAAERFGCATILWTVDTVDWRKPPAETIVQRAVDKSTNGSLILMHPTRPTLDALPAVIDGLRAKGLEPVIVSRAIGLSQGQALDMISVTSRGKYA